MANDVKWIRIKVDMFEGDSFKRVKRAEIDGVINFRDKLTAVWFELMLLAGKVNNNGYFFNDEVSYNTYEDLAIMIDRTTKEVEMCVSWFIKNRMIDENPFIITNFTKYQNNAGLEKIREQGRLRQREYRERKKLTASLPPKEKEAILIGDEEINSSVCAYCGAKEKDVGKLHIDHIIPLNKGGDGSIENFVKVCKSCNSSKKDKDLVDFLNYQIKWFPQNIDINLIINNSRLSRYVRFVNGRFENVTLSLRNGNALPLKDNNNSYSYSLKDLNNRPNTNNTNINKEVDIIIEYLNIKAKKRFKVVESNAKFIRARFEEGYTVEDLKQVIDTKVADWLDTEQAKYLRPETLFNATKFQSYINQKPKERVEEKNVPTNRY